MRLPPHVVAQLAALLHDPDPTDLVSPTGAHRTHVGTQPGDPDRCFELVLQSTIYALRQRAARLGISLEL